MACATKAKATGGGKQRRNIFHAIGMRTAEAHYSRPVDRKRGYGTSEEWDDLYNSAAAAVNHSIRIMRAVGRERRAEGNRLWLGKFQRWASGNTEIVVSNWQAVSKIVNYRRPIRGEVADLVAVIRDVASGVISERKIYFGL